MADLFEHAAIPSPGFPLNPEQRAAAQHGAGPLVVVAGAGTGKTRVITERIRFLLESQPALSGDEIVGLTFTDKAAAEMKHRVIAAARERGDEEVARAENVKLSTFHAFCGELLQEADPDLKPIDKVDHWILLRRNLPLLQLEQFRRLAEPGQFIGDFVEFFSRCQDELVTPDDYAHYAQEQVESYQRVRDALQPDEQAVREVELAKLQEVARAYRASDLLLRERKLLTFGSMLMDAVMRLRSDAELLQKLRARYRYLLVDEFQDTNVAQLELLWLLGGDPPNLVVVGDHRQAIYRFRGASFGSFTTFVQRFAPNDPAAQAKLLRPLTLNYRSSGRILRVAGQVISHNEKPTHLPDFPLTAVREEGDKVRIVTHESSANEAQWVAQELERLHRAGAKWRTFAVLYRGHGNRDKLVDVLKARKIPFVIKNLTILSHRLVRDLIAYLRLIDLPSDDVACARVLAVPAWGLEPSDLVRLAERVSKKKGTSLWDAVVEAAARGAGTSGVETPEGNGGETSRLKPRPTNLSDSLKPPDSPKLSESPNRSELLEFSKSPKDSDSSRVSAASGVTNFSGSLPLFENSFSDEPKTAGPETSTTIGVAHPSIPVEGGLKHLDELVALIVAMRKKSRSLTAGEIFEELAGALAIDSAVNGEDRKYFDRFQKFIAEWQPKSETARLKEFVEYLDFFEQAGGNINLEQEPGDAVQLMTVHGAKGLEFDHVYVLRLVQRGFPAGEKPRVLEFPAALMKEEQPQGSFHIQEERRLFYVAVTRARQRLTLSTVENKRSKPSTFLDDILMDAQIKRRDIEQLAPKAVLPAVAAVDPGATLFESPSRDRVGSRIGEWAVTYRPPVSEPLQVSPSAIDLLASCPQQYLFRQAWGLRGGPAAAISFGSVMHNTVKYFITELCGGRQLPFEEVEKKFELEWTSAGFEDEYQEQEYKKDGRAQLLAFHTSTMANPPAMLAQEKAFELPLENNVVLIGRMDQVNRIAGEEVEIVDYKTGRPRDAEKAKKDLQLSVYALAARELFDWIPSRLTFHNLQTNDAVSSDRDKKKLDKVIVKIQEAAADIRAGVFLPKLGFACRYCNFKSVCPAQEQGAAASASGEE